MYSMYSRLLQTTRLPLEKKFVKIVKNNFYVDDSEFSKPSTEQILHSSLELMGMLRKGNFRLTKFISNDKDVFAAIPAKERTIKNLDFDKLISYRESPRTTMEH